MLSVIIPVYETKQKYKLSLSEVSDPGLEPRTMGGKATAFAVGFPRQSPTGGCEENGVPWEKACCRLSPSPGVYKYALSKPGFAVGPGERAGKKNPTLSPR